MDLQKISLPIAAKTSPEPELPAKEISKKRPKFKLSRRAVIILLSVLALLIIFTAAIAIPAYLFFQPLRLTISSAQDTAASLQAQNLVDAEAKLNDVRTHLATSRAKYRYLSWLKFVPLLNRYYLDGDHALNAASSGVEAGSILIKAIEPYSDLLGFTAKSDATKVNTDSAEERIIFLAQTLDAISPQLDQINTHLESAKNEVNQINPKRYPENAFGKPIRSYLITLQDSLAAASVALTDARPLIKLLPDLLGQTKPKLYMLLFQNDAELRPTGGFMTAYAYLKVDQGKMTPLDSYDIYDLDARWGKTLPAPAPIKKYLPLVNNWNLRDMNLSPDFRLSMDTFYKHYKEIGGVRDIDGIIALDTQVPVELLKVLGPVGVGGWGNFSADNDPRCDCPQVVYSLENISTRPTNYIREDRKAVLGPLMHSIAANAMGAPKTKWPQLLEVGLNAIKEKHLLFYYLDETSQQSMEAFNAAGRILPTEGDYLHINDTNFAGAKSNMFTTQSVEHEITMAQDGTTTVTVTLTYNNPHPPSNCNLEAAGLCLNGILRDWVRLYVPKGSELIEMVGSEVAAVTSEDLDKTVFEGFFTLRPQSSSKLVVTYKLPGTFSTPYRLTLQKQPGKPNLDYNLIFNGQPQDLTLTGDHHLTLP